MRIQYLIVLLGLAAAICAGCGGGTGVVEDGLGSVSITIHWPERDRLIPLAANSIKVDITDGAGFTASQTVDRPAPPVNTSTIIFDAVPVGTLTVTATAYPEPSAAGTPQATGSTQVTTLPDQPVSVTLTMASTIDRLEVTPASPVVEPGASVQLTATPRNAAGEVVLTAPANITWASADPSVATVDSSSGLVTGVSEGSAQITATETESGKSATVTVSVVKVRVTISPQSATISIGKTQAFTATVTGTTNTAVTWSVQEGDAGGNITSGGVYTAPNTAGTYHVIATSVADPTASGTATVAVESGSLDVIVN